MRRLTQGFRGFRELPVMVFVQGFRGLGFRGLGFRGLGLRGLGFKGLGFRGLRLRVGFKAQGVLRVQMLRVPCQ